MGATVVQTLCDRQGVRVLLTSPDSLKRFSSTEHAGLHEMFVTSDERVPPPWTYPTTRARQGNGTRPIRTLTGRRDAWVAILLSARHGGRRRTQRCRVECGNAPLSVVFQRPDLRNDGFDPHFFSVSAAPGAIDLFAMHDRCGVAER